MIEQLKWTKSAALLALEDHDPLMSEECVDIVMDLVENAFRAGVEAKADSDQVIVSTLEGIIFGPNAATK